MRKHARLLIYLERQLMNTVKKYGPKTLDEFIYCDDNVRRMIKRYAQGKANLPLILHGTHGTGKSCLAALIPKAIDGDEVSVNRLNAEDLNSSQEVRKHFLRSSVYDKLFPLRDQSRYYTVIEEVNSEIRAQGALRVCIDRMGEIDLIILTTNEIVKMDKGLISRSEVIEILPLTPEQFFPKAREILIAEGIPFNDSDLLELLDSVYQLHKDNRKFIRP